MPCVLTESPLRGLALVVLATTLGCAQSDADGPNDDTIGSGIGSVGPGTDSVGADDEDDDDDDEKLDLASAADEGPDPCAEGGDCDECEASEHVPCDEPGADLFAAMGLGCPGEPEIVKAVDGSPAALGIRSGFGGTGEWAPREGQVFAVLGSGNVHELDSATPPGDWDDNPTFCNDELGEQYSKGGSLPAPLQATDVTGDCEGDPTQLGTGDCSNTIQDQFDQGGSANDYTEMRIEATVPPGTTSISYDLAFFSTEYPEYYQTGFNDMFVGWLQSEQWTGNVSFDAQGNPISLNAGFLDFRDDGGGTPELAGTCMERHAGTKWLTTTAPVSPGEDITLVLAIFDLADMALDSYVFLDNFSWGCEGGSGPQTTPVG